MLAADEVWRLQNGEDAECRLFQRFCDKGHYNREGSTRQGFYVVTARGDLLGSTNTRNPRRLRSMLEQALFRFAAVPAELRGLADADRAELEALWRWADEYPEDGLVLEVTSRDLVGTEERDKDIEHERSGRRRRRNRWTEHAWNRDYAWFRAAEARAWIPERQEVGSSHTVPAPLARRLAALHLVDNVRGQVPAFRDENVEDARILVEIIAIASDGVLSLRIEGSTRATLDDDEHGIRGVTTKLTGNATWDPSTSRFTTFVIEAHGTRWGTARFNVRRRQLAPSPLGFVLRLAPPDAPRVAPTTIWGYGWRPQRK